MVEGRSLSHAFDRTQGFHVDSSWTVLFSLAPARIGDMPFASEPFCLYLFFSLLCAVTVLHRVRCYTSLALKNLYIYINIYISSLSSSQNHTSHSIRMPSARTLDDDHTCDGSLEESCWVSATSIHKARLMRCNLLSRTSSSILGTHARCHR